MDTEEVLRRAHNNISLLSATTEEIEAALRIADRWFERYILATELKYRRPRKPTAVDGTTHVPYKGKCPTKRDLR